MMRSFQRALSQRTCACPRGPASLSIPLLPLAAQSARCVRTPLPAQPLPVLPRGVGSQHMTYGTMSKLLSMLLEGEIGFAFVYAKNFLVVLQI